jgi:hypothetical protein
LFWYEGCTDHVQQAEVTTGEQLDDLLDVLVARALKLGLPFNVTLDEPGGTTMDIIVGASIASVEWSRDDPWECRVSVSSEDDGDEAPIEFAGGGQYSELARRWWINAPVAREAVRHYFLTGELTPTVRWELF